MGFYEAKFAREAKENPRNWLIAHGRDGYRLIYMGDNDNGNPDL